MLQITVFLPLSAFMMWISVRFFNFFSVFTTLLWRTGLISSSGSDNLATIGMIRLSDVHVCSSGVHSLLTIFDNHPLLGFPFFLYNIICLLMSEMSLLRGLSILFPGVLMEGMKLSPRHRTSIASSEICVVDWLIRNFFRSSLFRSFALAKNWGL